MDHIFEFSLTFVLYFGILFAMTLAFYIGMGR
jgi:hypothetical protein